MRPADVGVSRDGRLGLRGRMTMALVLVAGLSLGGVASRGAAQDPEPPVQIVDVFAERFSFSPSEIKTTLGTTLEIRLRSDDTNHGFRIVGTDVNIVIPKRGRGVTTVKFTPEQAGRFTFECSKLCGAGHSFMRGVIVVSEPPAAEPK